MKSNKLTLLFSLGLLATLAGAFILASAGQTPVIASVKFDPNFIDWDSPAAMVWLATIRPGEYEEWNPADIDGSTVVFEGTAPNLGGYAIPGGYVAEFDGLAVHNKIAAMIGHMGVPPDATTKTPIKYYFIVTGNLNDGTPFEGEGWIKVRFPGGLPPPPPPPT